jgi:GNAT superfamily N-acetyltransferase
MECALLGWPDDGPTLELDHREFAYAGRFRVASTGKAVAREDDAILAATAFNEDRSDPSTLKIRTVTVRRESRGEGIGPELLRYTRERASGRGYDRVVIAVNNPFAYEAAVRAGFGYTGEETGIAEVVLAWPAPEGDRYVEGLRRFRERDLEPVEEEFLDRTLSEGVDSEDGQA